MGSERCRGWRARRGGFALLAWILLAPLPGHATSGPAQTGLFAPAKDAVTANLNPAGLTRIRRPEWVFQGLYFTSQSRFEQQSSREGTTVDNNDGSTFIPFVYYARPISERLGAGFYVTGVSFSEDLDDDNPSRYLVDEWNLGNASLVPSLAYRIGESFSFGASLVINYNFYEFESAVFNGPNQPDGRMKVEDEDISFGFALGLLHEFTPSTRAGLIFRSETEASFEDTPSFRDVTRPIPSRDREISFDTTFPAAVGAGFYHRFDDGSSLTLDLLWSNFQEFGLSELQVGNLGISVDSGDFENVVAGSLGYAWRVNERWELRVGGLYLSQPIKDSNRTFAFRLDRVWGVGVGAEYAVAPGRLFGLSVTYYDLGKGRSTGRDLRNPDDTLTGKFTERYAILFDVTFRWVR